MSDLAGVLDDEGRHGEAETLYRETLQLRREVLGERDPRTITSMSDLAGVLDDEGRHGEAETLYRARRCSCAVRCSASAIPARSPA